MFKKEINPFSVSDKVRFRNVDKTLTLTVKADGNSIVLKMRQAKNKLSELTDESQECERVNAARFLAAAMFGNDQANKLIDFYEGEPLPVISACGQYFNDRLAKLITKAQKK